MAVVILMCVEDFAAAVKIMPVLVLKVLQRMESVKQLVRITRVQ